MAISMKLFGHAAQLPGLLLEAHGAVAAELRLKQNRIE